MSNVKRFLLATAAWAYATAQVFAASSNLFPMSASPALPNTNQFFYCPIVSTATTGSELKCTAAQIAAYNYSLMSGDCTATGTGAITCTKSSGTAFGPLATASLSNTRAGDIVYWNGAAWAVLAGNNTGTAVLTESSVGVPSWAAGAGVASITISCPASGTLTGAVTISNALNVLAKTTSYTGSATDCGAALQFTISSAATYTPPAPASVGSGYSISILQNYFTSTASLTVTPAAGTINGSASLVLTPGSSVALWTDGTNYFATGNAAPGSNTVDFASSGTYIPTTGIIFADVYCVGAGSGGGSGPIVTSGTAASGGAGGSAASGAYGRFTATQLGGSVAVTLGTAGAGGLSPTAGTAAAGNPGSAGGNTTFGTLLKAWGGGSSAGGAASVSAGSGGSAGFGGAGGNASGATPGSAGLFTGQAGSTGNGSANVAIGLGSAGGGSTTSTSGAGGTGWSGAGGGAGGSIGAAPTANAGSTGGATLGNGSVTGNGSAGTSGGGNGGAGQAATNNLTAGGYVGGGAGGGGGSSITVAGGNGGNGQPGSGGGGGGGTLSLTAANAGAGGSGGPGHCTVVENF